MPPNSERGFPKSKQADGSDTGGAKVSARERNRLLLTAVIVCSLSFLIVGWLPQLFYHQFEVQQYLQIHIVLEFIGSLVSFSVFVIGWYGYKQNRNKQDLVIGLVFLTTGLIGIVHTLSYSGMPDFLSPNTVSKASTYWIIERLTNSLGLFLAAFLGRRGWNRWTAPGLLMAACLVFVAAVAMVVAYYPQVLPPMFIPGLGQTALKIRLEWIIVALFTAAIFVLWARNDRRESVVLLQLALIINAFAELSFTLYKSAYDTYNLLGHVYQVVAYYIIFRGLFLSSFQSPYAELVKARDRVERSFSSIGVALAGSLELNKVLQLIAELSSDMLRSGHAAVMLLREGELHVQARKGLSEDVRTVSMHNTSAGEALRTRATVIRPDVCSIEGHGPHCHCQHVEGLPSRSVASAPIVYDRDAFGVIEVYSAEKDAFGTKDAELLSAFARQAAVAIRNSMAYERERHIAEALQRSLLPSAPTVDGLDIAVRYVPADDSARVGGDLYDVFLLDDGLMALVIGDVCGHGWMRHPIPKCIHHTSLSPGYLPGGRTDAQIHSHLIPISAADGGRHWRT